MPKSFVFTETRFDGLAVVLRLSEQQKYVLRKEMGFSVGNVPDGLPIGKDSLSQSLYQALRRGAWQRFGGLPEEVD